MQSLLSPWISELHSVPVSAVLHLKTCVGTMWWNIRQSECRTASAELENRSRSGWALASPATAALGAVRSSVCNCTTVARVNGSTRARTADDEQRLSLSFFWRWCVYVCLGSVRTVYLFLHCLNSVSVHSARWFCTADSAAHVLLNLSVLVSDASPHLRALRRCSAAVPSSELTLSFTSTWNLCIQFTLISDQWSACIAPALPLLFF